MLRSGADSVLSASPERRAVGRRAVTGAELRHERGYIATGAERSKSWNYVPDPRYQPGEAKIRGLLLRSKNEQLVRI